MSNKHDANVRKSTFVNFQIGLVASLLFTYVMFEMYTTVPVINDEPVIVVNEPPVEWNEVFKVYVEPEQKTVAVKHTKSIVDPQKFKVINDTEVVKNIDEVFKIKPPVESAYVDPNKIKDVGEEEEIVNIPFAVIENVPVFPGCENAGDNAAKKQCMSEKVKKFINRKFNTELGSELGLSGINKIYVQFKIDRNGNIVGVQARGPHTRLEKEAGRVIKLLPKMTPGKQRGKAVGVLYALPITFKVQN